MLILRPLELKMVNDDHGMTKVVETDTLRVFIGELLLLSKT